MTEAIERVAHDGGDNAIINHCPFCGSGAVVGRSDGSAQCGFCHTTFTVQVQPQYPNAPQTIDGNPNQIPGMPGEQPTEMSRPTDPAVPPDKPQETTLPAGTPAPNDANATPDSADGAKPPEKKKNLPPWLKNKASSRTAAVVPCPECAVRTYDADGEPLPPTQGPGCFFCRHTGLVEDTDTLPSLMDATVGDMLEDRARPPVTGMYVTAQGVALDEDSYVRHLAIHNADDKAAVLTQVRAENGR